MNPQSTVIFIILILIMIPAVKNTVRHMRGQGSCCGGPVEKPVKKKINGEIKGKLLIKIDGMHCTNCKNRIEKHLDELDGVIAKVNLEKKQAIVTLYQDIDVDVIKETIEGLDFTVKEIEDMY